MKSFLTITSIIITLYICCVAALAQTPLRGIVTIQNSKNTPLAGAEVLATLYANPDLTDSEGKFELLFVGKEPGDRVEFEVKKKGYEVVNRKTLVAILRKDSKRIWQKYIWPKRVSAIKKL